MDRELTKIDAAILRTLATGEINQATLVKALLPLTGESYLLARMRHLEALGYLVKTPTRGNGRLLNLTPAGEDLVKTSQADPGRPHPIPTGGG